MIISKVVKKANIGNLCPVWTMLHVTALESFGADMSRMLINQFYGLRLESQESNSLEKHARITCQTRT